MAGPQLHVLTWQVRPRTCVQRSSISHIRGSTRARGRQRCSHPPPRGGGPLMAAVAFALILSGLTFALGVLIGDNR